MEDYVNGGGLQVAGANYPSRPTSAMRRNHSLNVYVERPASSASNKTRNTMSSSGASAAGSSLPNGNSTPRMGGAKGGSLLQERLRERKVESGRSASASEGRGVQSSPIKGSSAREERRPSSGGLGPAQAGKGMGVKQMEDQVSTLHKQNFDLKLELYHRRQRQEALEAKLLEKEKLLEEFAEMREVNDQLLAELERRDQALDEAVGVIVNLEDKIDSLMREREMVRSVEENPYNPPPEFSSSPPQMTEEIPRKNIVRMPSFLSERSEGTEALRSLYLPSNHTYSEASLPKLEEESMDGMNSPRLSILSESSFLSVYGDKLDLNEPAEEQPSRRRSSVEKWVGDRPDPNITPRRPSPEFLRKKQFLSINDVLESPLQRLEKLRHTLEKATQSERQKTSHTKRHGGDVKSVFIDKHSFEKNHSLPPTPDTFSTNTLRHIQGSDDTLAHRGTIMSTTSTFNPGLVHNKYKSTISIRPRSAGETITSRREGHGWDTETQADTTDAGSTTSTYSPSAAYQPVQSTIKRVRTPDLFNFNASEQRRGDWGRDVLFNHHNDVEELDLPPLNNKRIIRARRSSMIDSPHPRSDDTVVQYNGHQADRRSAVLPLDNYSPRPDPPDRRSSITAMQKIRKVNHAASSPIPPKDNPQSPQALAPTPTTSRKSRLASKIFGRNANSASTSTTSDSSTTTTNQEPSTALVLSRKPELPKQSSSLSTSLPRQRTAISSGHRSYSTQYIDPSHPSSSHFPSHHHRRTDSVLSQEEADRATPPPIRRSKTYATTNVPPRANGRPNSAGAGAGSGRIKRMSGFAEDGADGDFAAAGNGVNAGGERVLMRGGQEKENGHRRGSLSVEIGVARGLGALLGGGGGAPTTTAEDAEKGDTTVEGKRKWLGLRRG